MLKIDTVEARVQSACDEFIRQQSTLATKGSYNLSETKSDASGLVYIAELPEDVLAAHVGRPYTGALMVFDGTDTGSPDADAAPAMIGRSAPIQGHVDNWESAFLAEIQWVFVENFPDVEVTPDPSQSSMPEWRTRAVELCADW